MIDQRNAEYDRRSQNTLTQGNMPLSYIVNNRKYQKQKIGNIGCDPKHKICKPSSPAKGKESGEYSKGKQNAFNEDKRTDKY